MTRSRFSADARSSRVHTGLAFIAGWKQYADDAAWRPQSPRRHTKTGDDERGDDMKPVRTVAAHPGAGCGRACQVKEDAGIGPLLEARKAGHEDGDRSKYFPKAQDREKVHGVAKAGHHAMGVARILCDLRGAAASDRKRHEYGH